MAHLKSLRVFATRLTAVVAIDTNVFLKERRVWSYIHENRNRDSHS